ADTVTPSRSARTLRLAPRESRTSARFWDVYAAVPRVSMEAVKSASPSRPGGSYTAPARRYPRMVTAGLARFSRINATDPSPNGWRATDSGVIGTTGPRVLTLRMHHRLRDPRGLRDVPADGPVHLGEHFGGHPLHRLGSHRGQPIQEPCEDRKSVV